MVADVDGQLEAGDMAARPSVEGVREHGAAEAAAAGRGGQAEVGDLPGVAVGDLGQEEDRRGLRLAGEAGHLPAPATNRPPARWLARMSSSERMPSSSGMSRLPS